MTVALMVLYVVGGSMLHRGEHNEWNGVRLHPFQWGNCNEKDWIIAGVSLKWMEEVLRKLSIGSWVIELNAYGGKE